MTKLGKAIKATYHCGNCLHWGGERWYRFGKCSVWDEKTGRSAKCDVHRRSDITDPKLLLAGPGRRSPARRSEAAA